MSDHPDTDLTEWPRAIWAGERMPDEISGYHVFSKHATIARFDGDIERAREFHCYVDTDIFDSEQRYHEHQRAALAAERDDAIAQADARVAAAYEDAANELQRVVDNWNCGHMESRLCDCAAYVEQWELAANTIREITMPAGARAALSRLTAQARAQGMREAAMMTANIDGIGESLMPVKWREKIIARAEEIEKEAAR